MLFDDAETRRINALIRSSATAWSAKELQDVLAEVRKHKPIGYDAHVAGLRTRYSGNQAEVTKAALKTRFPRTHSTMPVAPLNWLRFFAAQDSGVYRLPPERTLVDVDDDARKAEFADCLRECDLDGIAPEMERRAILPRTLFVLPRWSGKPVAGKMVLDLYWPDDVGVICHPSDPRNFALCVLLVVRIASPGGPGDTTRWYNIWTRDVIDDDMGQPESWGPWRVHVVNSEGNYLVAPNDDRTLYRDAAGNALESPWCLLQIGEANGSVFVDDDRDVVAISDSLNVSRSSEMDVVDLQGFDTRVYSGNEMQANEIPTGPGEVVRIGQGEAMSLLSPNPKIAEMRLSRAAALREVAVTRRNSPSAYSTDGTPASTATAKKIEERAHDAALDELSHRFRSFEERQLLPKIVMVHDAFSGRTPIGPCKFSVVTRRPPDIEEPEAKQRRLKAEYDDGIISKAQMAVELGRYPNVDAAVKAGISADLKSSTPSSLPAFGFRAAQAKPDAPPVADNAPDPSGEQP